MSADLLTCKRVGEENLDTRYLAGRLSDAESAAFEEHYFACDRCWTLVQQGLEVSEALAEDRSRPRRRSAWPWWGLGAAASIAAVGVTFWRGGPAPTRSPSGQTVRGQNQLPILVGTEGPGITATWPSVAEAEVYRIRLYTGDGRLLLEREIAETTITVPVDSLPRLAAVRAALWDVEALNRLRDPVGGSELTEAVFPSNPP